MSRPPLADLGLGHVRLEDAADLAASAPIAEYGPAEGAIALRRAVAAWESVAPEQVVITTGASMGLVASLATLDRPGSILCPRPYYPSYPKVARELGLRVLFYDLSPERSWLPDPEQILGLLEKDTRAILWNFPSNPAGSVPSRELIASVAEIARDRGLEILSDEVYADFLYDGAGRHEARSWFEGTALILLRSFSKIFGIPGERVGYAVTTPERAQAIARAHWTFAMSPPATGQARALAALLSQPDRRIESLRLTLASHRDEALAILARSSRLRAAPPPAGVFLWIGIEDSPHPSEVLARACWTDRGVVVVPGKAFGMEGPAYLRASFAVPRAQLRCGFETLVDWAEDL